MKGRYFLGAAVLGVFLLGFSTVSQAGGWMQRSAGSGEGEMKAAERTQAQEPEALDSSSWQYFEATETGKSPPSAGPEYSSAREIAPVLWDQPHVKPLVGGLEFRDIDVGP